MTSGDSRSLAAPLVGGAARVALGVLWLIEGMIKVRAGFGSADILLVADSAANNSRVPDYFAPLGEVMRALSGLFGIGIPVLEFALGILLILGVLPRIAALASIGTLALYWSADQLAPQYPVMMVLTALVLAIPRAGEWSLTAVVRRARGRSAQRMPVVAQQAAAPRGV